MCSLEDAWGSDYMIKYTDIKGTQVDNRNVASQGYLHDAYNKTPDELLHQGQMTQKTAKPTKRLEPGAHVKSRINSPSIQSPYANMTVQTNDNTHPLPSPISAPNYASFNENTISPSTMSASRGLSISGSAYDDAFMEGDAVKHFMASGINTNPALNNISQQTQSHSYPSNKMNTRNIDNNTNSSNDSNVNDELLAQQIASAQNINKMLEHILYRLDHLENKLTENSSKNIHDMILYTVFGILIAIVIYAIIAGITKSK